MSLLICILLLIGIFGMIRFALTEGFAFVWYSVTRLFYLPFAPFIVASRIKKEKPIVSKALLIIWSLVYLVVAFIIFLYWKTS